MGPYNSHGCAGTTLTSPANGATGLSSTPLLTIGTSDGAFSGSLNSTIQVCTTSNCSSVAQTSPTFNSTAGTASWTPSALANGTYWWKASTCDFYGNCGDPTPIWSFTVGGAGNTAPTAPSSLAQYRSDGITAIATAAWTNQSTVVLKFNVSDPDASQTLTPWVEISSTGSFSGTCGTAGANMFSGSNVTATTGGTNYLATVTVTGLVDGSTYYWRACSKDQAGSTSGWTARAGAPDFRVDANAPTNPTSAEIFDLSTTFSLAVREVLPFAS